MKRLILTLITLFTLSAQAQESEQFQFRMSFSGFITGYMWKDLAEMSMSLAPDEIQFQGQPAKRIHMSVTTEDYSFSEAIHALRYRWESILDSEMKRTLLVRVVDDGDNESHDVYWYQWPEKSIATFSKREQEDVTIPFFHEETKLKWETNTHPAPPAFIDSHAPVADGLSYLIMNKLKRDRLTHDAIDPLSMLVQLRHHDYQAEPELTLNVIHEDDLDPYKATLMSSESIDYDGEEVTALKLRMQRDTEEGEEGAMTMWLSDDERRLPLRIDVEAPLGALHMKLLPPAGEEDYGLSAAN